LRALQAKRVQLIQRYLPPFGRDVFPSNLHLSGGNSR
jgi:hypothetical protein